MGLSREQNFYLKLQQLAGQKPGQIGIGDDAAFIPLRDFPSNGIIVAKDVLVEDVHFSLKYCSLPEIARKLVAVNVSDLFVKGGTPRFAFSAFSAPRDFFQQNGGQEIFMTALLHELGKYNIELMGGDTTSAAKLYLSLTLFGTIDNFIPRSTDLSRGDKIWQLGKVGASNYALRQLLENKQISDEVRQKYACPTPALQGPLLQGKASIDQSDSVYETLSVLAAKNNVQLEIDLNKFQIHDEVKFPDLEFSQFVLSAAEDLAVFVITTPSEKIEKAVCIGIVADVDCEPLLCSNGREIPVPSELFDHYEFT